MKGSLIRRRTTYDGAEKLSSGRSRIGRLEKGCRNLPLVLDGEEDNLGSSMVRTAASRTASTTKSGRPFEQGMKLGGQARLEWVGSSALRGYDANRNLRGEVRRRPTECHCRGGVAAETTPRLFAQSGYRAFLQRLRFYPHHDSPSASGRAAVQSRRISRFHFSRRMRLLSFFASHL